MTQLSKALLVVLAVLFLAYAGHKDPQALREAMEMGTITAAMQ